jgi:putative oxidoreductase
MPRKRWKQLQLFKHMHHNQLHKNMHDAGLLMLRIGFAFFMIPHGMAKLDRYMASLSSQEPLKFFNFLGLGPEISLWLTLVAELLAPVLLIVGFKTRWLAAVAAFCMAVAGFWIHRADPLGEKEHALLYFVAFTAIALTGPGRWSLDAFWHKQRD